MSGAKFLATRRAGSGLLDAEALDDGCIAPEEQLSSEPPFELLILVRGERARFDPGTLASTQ
jgi:hypothetical protein